MIKHIQILFVFLLVVVSFRFFDARFLNESFTNYFVFLYVLSAITLSISYVFTERIGFVFPVQLIVLSMLISIAMAGISWGQSLKETILVTVPLMLWVFFFYLMHIKIPIKIIEGIILIYGVLYILIYFFQLTNSQTVFFGGLSGFLEERGTVRILIGGGGVFFLSSFLCLNKLTTKKRGRWLWITLSILGIVIPFFQATRQFIAGVLIIYLFHFIKDLSFFRKSIILASFIGLLFYLSHSDNEIIKGISEAQVETLQQGKEYIRIQSGSYFLTEFSPDNISRVLGNGVPYEDISYYGKFVEDLKLEGFYLSDVGIFAVYAMFGILAIIAYVLIWIKSLTLPLPKEYYYLKYYLWFLFITSLTSDNVYSYNYLISTVFTLYIYQILYMEHVRLNNDFRTSQLESHGQGMGAV
jgi:hypothetical protein